jgi:hypothetical protein
VFRFDFVSRTGSSHAPLMTDEPEAFRQGSEIFKKKKPLRKF